MSFARPGGSGGVEQSGTGGVNVANTGKIGGDLHLTVQTVERTRTPRSLRRLAAGTADFTGRSAESALIGELLLEAGRPGRVSPVVILLTGMPGGGKTALATHVAHAHREAFPSQLGVTLGGTGVPVRRPAEVLEEFLDALGTPRSQVPADLEPRAARYRQELEDLPSAEGRTALIVLDNATSEEQVRPLLPGGSGCAVIITSRYELSGLDGVVRLEVGTLTPADARALLDRLAGSARTDREPEAARQIVEHCGRLPLAIRIAGATLASRLNARRSLDAYASRLASEEGRLAALKAGDRAVEASFAVAYQELTDAGRRAFRLLGTVRLPEMDLDLVAALLESTPQEAEEVLGTLVTAHLVDIMEVNGRFRLHDLLRLYAAQLASPEEHRSALGRVREWYLEQATAATAWLRPDGAHLRRGRRIDAFDWLDGERANLVALTVQAEQDHADAFVCRMASTLLPYLKDGRHLDDWQRVGVLGLASARRAGDPRGEAVMMAMVGAHAAIAGPADPAGLTRLEEALAMLDEQGERASHAAVLGLMADACAWSWSNDRALAAAERCRAAYRELGDVPGEAEALMRLARLRGQPLLFDEAMGLFTQALMLWRSLDDPHFEARTLLAMAGTDRLRAHVTETIDHLQAARRAFARAADRAGEAETLEALGDVLAQYGYRAEGHQARLAALEIWKELGHDRNTARALHGLIMIACGQGLWRDAWAYLDVWRAVPAQDASGREAEELALLTHICQRQGRFAEAISHGHRLLEITPAHERPAAAENLAALYLDQGDIGKARELLDTADQPDDPEQWFPWIDEGSVLRDLHRNQGEYQRARLSAERLVSRFTDLGDQNAAGWALTELGNIELEAENYEGALEAVHRVLAIRQVLRDPYRQGWCLTDLARIHAARGDLATALSYLEQGLRLRNDSGNRFGVGQMHAEIASVLIRMRRTAEAETHIAHMYEAFEERGPGVSYLSQLAWDYAGIHEFGRAAAMLEASLGYVRRHRSFLTEIEQLADLGYIRFLDGQERAGREILESALALCREREHVPGEISVLHDLAAVHREAGQPESAEEHYRLALELARSVEFHVAEVSLLWALADLAASERHFTEAVDLLTGVSDLCRRLGDKATEARASCALGEVLVTAERPGEALACFEHGAEISRSLHDLPQEARCVLGLARAHAKMGERAQMENLVQTGLSLVEGLQETAHHAACLGLAADAANDLGDPDLALSYLVRQRDAYRDRHDPDSEAAVLLTLARTARTAGLAAEATAHLHAGLEIRERIGDAKGAAEIRSLLEEFPQT